MEYTEVKIFVKTEDTERASSVAIMTVPYGIYIEDYSDLEQGAWEIAHIDLIDEDLLKKNREESIIHVFIEEGNNPAEAVSFISERLNAESISHRIETDGVNSDDWQDKWKAFFKPQAIGE
jgi:ribosomal protein L11 methyltransferase